MINKQIINRLRSKRSLTRHDRRANCLEKCNVHQVHKPFGDHLFFENGFQRRLRTKYNMYVIGILAVLMSSCSGDNSDLMRYINSVKNRPAQPIEPIPTFAPLSTFKFPENDNRRSPFKPVDIRKKTDLFAPDQKRKKQPLEAYTLDALKFVGTLKQDNEIWALIKDPEKITPIKLGDYMGQNYGRIISIKNDEIKLEETIKNSGTWEKHITTLNLDTGK